MGAAYTQTGVQAKGGTMDCAEEIEELGRELGRELGGGSLELRNFTSKGGD